MYKLQYFICNVTFLLVVYCNFVSGSGIGTCPKYPTMENFNMTRVLGRWYEVERSFYLMELTSSCTTVDITKTDKGQLEIETTSVNRWTGNPSNPSRGFAKTSKLDPSIFKYQVHTRLPNTIARLMPGSGTYQVLLTDYDNYAIIWTCSNMGIAHTDMLWVLGRSRNIDALKRAEIYGELTNLSIDSDRLVASKNANCPPK